MNHYQLRALYTRMRTAEQAKLDKLEPLTPAEEVGKLKGRIELLTELITMNLW